MSDAVSSCGVCTITNFHRTAGPATVALLCLFGTACSGPIETRSGIAGARLPATATVAVVASYEQDDAVSTAARAAVAKALMQHGYAVSDDGAVRLTVALGERPASLEVLGTDGMVLSAAKRPKLLQNCDDRTERLTLVAENPGGGVSRAWAEEDHCKSARAQAVQPLAAQAVGRLVGAHQPGRAFRFGRD